MHGFPARTPICQVFTAVSVCNLQALQRFWRLLKSLQSAKTRGCPPSMAVLTVDSVCNFECFTLAVSAVSAVADFYRGSFCFSFCYLTLPSSNLSSITTSGYHHRFPMLKGSCHHGDANMLEMVTMAPITPCTVPCQVVSPLGKNLSREKVRREGGKVLRLAFHLD